MNRMFAVPTAVVLLLSMTGAFVQARVAPRSHRVSTVTRCYVGQLALKPIASSGATGHLGVQFRFHNRSSRACNLYGFPGAQLLTGSRRPLPTHMQWGDGYISGIQRNKTVVRMAPGANSYFVMEWTHIPSPGQTCPVAPLIRITPPNDYSSILVHMTPYGIDACRGILNVTPVSGRPFPI